MVLCIGIVAAEEISDFEKLLREALQNNRNNQTKKTDSDSPNRTPQSRTLENRVPEKAKPLSIASKNTLYSSVIDAKPVVDAKPVIDAKPAVIDAQPAVKPKEPVPPKSSAAPSASPAVKSSAKPSPPEPAPLNDGWVAIKPNDPNAQRLNNGNEKSVLAAETAKSGVPAVDPNASVWDAVPEVISSTAKPQGFEKPELLQNNQNIANRNIANQNIGNQSIAQNTTQDTVQDIAESIAEPVITKPVIEPKPFTNPLVIQPSPWNNTVDNSESKPLIDWNAVANGANNEVGNETDSKTDGKTGSKTDGGANSEAGNGTANEAVVEEKSSGKSSEENDAKTSPSEVPVDTVENAAQNPAQESVPAETNQPNQPELDLTVPKSKTPAKSQSTTPAKTAESITGKADENLNIDMNAILNALANESGEDSKEDSGKDSKAKDSKAKDSGGKDAGEGVANKSGGERTEKAGTSADSHAFDIGKSPITPETLAPVSPELPERIKPEPVVPDFDNDEDEEETEWKLVNADNVGDPHSRDKIKLLYDEIVNGLKARNITSRYEMWKGYARSTLRSTAGLNTGSELDGRCRLTWYQQLYNEPVQSVFAVEEYSRKLHYALSNSHRHLAEIMPDIRKKMDVPERNNKGIRFLPCTTPFEAVNEVKRCLLEAQMAHARALSTLTEAEQSELAKNLIPTFIGAGRMGGMDCVNGHTIPNRTFGRRLCNLLEKMDKTGMYDAAEALIPLTNRALLALLDKLPDDAFPTVMLSGQKVQRLSTAAGDIIISGRESNIYDLDSQDMSDVACIIDLGGNDSYREGTCDLNRPVLAIIDLHGDDIYSGSKPCIQGASILGVSILIDADGRDTYSAGDLAQGSTLGGIGMLFDFAGDDSYKALRRVQGHALEGLGMLVDRKGNDKYRATMWAQGFGAPGGFGVIEDTEGDDHYYCGGFYLDSYPEHPGYDGWGQGVGAGIRQVANGGVGALLDGDGDDNYEVDYFGHGGGYWLGVGFVRDFGGNDTRHGCTLTAYSGGPRLQDRWTRFANGFGCHYSLGYCFDDNGNDTYGGRIMGTGMAWDLSIGYLCDFNGSNRFLATGGMTQGVGAEGSIGVLFTYGGDDQFAGRNQAYSSNNITYHLPSNCGGNFSFLINYGGNDKYGCGAANNSYVQRGSAGGFLIDRPTDREAAEDLKVLKVLAEKRSREIAEYDEAFKKATEEAALKGRRYVSRQRRPQPISAEQPQRLSSVPYFENMVKTGAGTINNIK